MKLRSKFQLKSLAFITAAGVLLGASATASAAPVYQIFKVNEGAVPTVAGHTDTPSHIVTADQFNGGYTEEYVPGTGNSFTAYTYFSVGAYTLGGATVSSYLSTPDSGGGYSVYALITSHGTVSSSGPIISFTGASNSLQLFIDPNKDTSNTLSTSGFNLTSTSEDQLLATAAGTGYGTLDTTQTGPNAGSFGITFNNFDLTTLGGQYYFSPKPFYITLLASGDFNTFDPSTPSQFIGSANVRFVPEPSSVLMIGVGLVALAFTYRVRQRKDRA